ncbi:DUF2894 domain-containing protein [Bordetella petrii]|uniref:DUF2894 domain-containing protein n=1 Tax=Bordetella petrii TaxID=94624 RepID=UPI001E42FDBC|nr:DUF2894 domain-containing protein [Bordetella petrii]MCD0505355.1 DUF2894 domain-containing protein [Bordetella petrii]
MTSRPPCPAQQTLDAWREQGADRLDPLRFHTLQGMARRAAGLRGEARRILDGKLAEQMAQYGARVAATARAGQGEEKPAARAVDSTLAGLLAHIEAQAGLQAESAPDNPAGRRALYPELESLDYFRATWARVSTDRQLRQSEEQVHENAGPLNSNHLVHRGLQLMREQSAGYLHQFLAYLDALSWMDQLNHSGALAGKPVARPRKSGRTAR